VGNKIATHDNSVIIEEAVMHSSGTENDTIVTL